VTGLVGGGWTFPPKGKFKWRVIVQEKKKEKGGRPESPVR